MGLQSLLSMVGLVISVNAGTTTIPHHHTRTLSPKKFLDYMLKEGDDAKVDVGRDAELLSLPVTNNQLTIKGDSTEEHAFGAHSTKKSSSELVLGSDGKPKTMLIVVDDDAPPGETWSTSTEYKFDLDGHFLQAVTVKGKQDAQGQAITGSGVSTLLNSNDPKVKRTAKAEYDYWLQRAAENLAKKAKASKKN